MRISDWSSDVCSSDLPGIRLVAFGHVGDGNIHFNPMQPQAADGSQWKENTEDVNRIVHDLVHELGGSISAEHGIGQLRIGELERYKPAIDLDLMAHHKNLFDPYNIMNPGKLVRSGWIQSLRPHTIRRPCQNPTATRKRKKK